MNDWIDYTKIVLEKIKNLGYETAFDYMQDHPKVSFKDLAISLAEAEDVSEYVFALKHLYYQDAQKTNKLRFVNQDALVRYLHEYRVNWKRKTKSIKNRIAAFAKWSIFVCVRLKNDLMDVKQEMIVKQIWDYLEEQVPPNYDWLPESADDPLIQEAFDKFWSEEV